MCSEEPSGLNGPHSSRCICPQQYTGTHCERRNHCYPNPCRNSGTCINGLSSFRCICLPKYTSTRCEHRNYCYPNHCRNGGTCINLLDSFRCHCPSIYTGTHCEYRLGYFWLYARYGNGLQDLDGWCLYLVVIACDNRGYSVHRSTRYIAGDLSPVRNQWFYFTYKRVWTRFTM